MNRTATRLLLAAALAASSAALMAQTPANPPAPGQMRERMAERHEHRMAELKAKLNITPQQEAAWTAFAAAMQPPAPPQRMSREEAASLTTPERIDHMQQRAAERQERMTQRGEAIKAFYAQLTPDQQKAFDEHAASLRRPQGPKGKPRAQ
jgi:Spy/CpxP family protein refolding chaperone